MDKVGWYSFCATIAGLGIMLATIAFAVELDPATTAALLFSGGILMAGGAAGVVLVLLSWHDKDTTTLPLVRRLLPSPSLKVPAALLEEPPEVESSYVEVETIEREWLPEVEQFGTLAGTLWEVLDRRWVSLGAYGQGMMVGSLNPTVRSAGWPRDSGLSEDTDAHLAQAWLFDFCERLYRGSTDDFDGIRQDVARLVKRWHVRLSGDRGDAFRSWLPDDLGRFHVHTLTLMRYVEEEKAKSFGNPNPDYEPLEAIRDLLSDGEGDLPEEDGLT